MMWNVFFWLVVLIGMVMFPLVTLVFKGDYTVRFIKGCVFGASFTTNLVVVEEEDEEVLLQAYGISLYIFFISITMVFSIRRDDLEITEDEDY